MRASIKRIHDMPTLMLISEVCEINNPDISDVASMKIKAYLTSTEHKKQIKLWADDVVEEDTETGSVRGKFKHHRAEVSTSLASDGEFPGALVKETGSHSSEEACQVKIGAVGRTGRHPC